MSKICLRYAQDLPKIRPKYAQDIPQIPPTYDQDISFSSLTGGFRIQYTADSRHVRTNRQKQHHTQGKKKRNMLTNVKQTYLQKNLHTNA